VQSFKKLATLCLGIGFCGVIAGCASGSGVKTVMAPLPTYALTVDSFNPSRTAVTISAYPADNNRTTSGTASFTLTYNSGTAVTLTAPSTAGNSAFSSWTGCASTSGTICTVTMSANTTVTANYAAAFATYALTVNSTNPSGGVSIAATPADVNQTSSGNTSFTLTYNPGTTVTLTAPSTAGGNSFSSWTGCSSTSGVTCTANMSANTTVTAAYATSASKTTPAVTVQPTPSSITTAQSVTVAVLVAATSGTPTGSVVLTSGSYTSAAATISSGGATIVIPPNSLASGSDTLTVSYTPDTAASALFTSASGTATLSVTAAALIAPTVMVTPASAGIAIDQPLSVTVNVNGGNGNPTPTGTVQLQAASYSSAATTLSQGNATINIPANSLVIGADNLIASYTPDSASSSIYKTVLGEGTVQGLQTSSVTIDQSSGSSNPVVTDQLMGTSLGVWFDVLNNASTVQTAFQTAGIDLVRWPGGSTSDQYNWQNNTYCSSSLTNAAGQPQPPFTVTNENSHDTFANFVTSVVKQDNISLALTADYGTNADCTGPGDPSVAAAWAAQAQADGIDNSTNPVWMTIGNEVFGNWETDLHSSPNNATTYANAVDEAGTGYYAAIKAASPNTLVGVVVNAGGAGGTNSSWDQTVLGSANGSYDFVEFHFYPQLAGSENDSTLIHQDAQELTSDINTIKSEMAQYGTKVPIYVGEIGSVSTDPGKQTWSITQGLYAGQALGEMMNDGVAKATWWIAFGGCEAEGAGNESASLYGWQDWGGYNIFSDASPNCPGDGPLGTLSPTARVYQLFQNVAVNGEQVLTAHVTGDTSDIRAYAATHNQGKSTALVLFNLSESYSLPVTLTLSSQGQSQDVKVITYDKSLYDQTDVTPPASPVWAGPTTNDMGPQSLAPLSLTLTPWSMNVVMIQ
jgi:hypothetical protein